MNLGVVTTRLERPDLFFRDKFRYSRLHSNRNQRTDQDHKHDAVSRRLHGTDLVCHVPLLRERNSLEQLAARPSYENFSEFSFAEKEFIEWKEEAPRKRVSMAEQLHS